MIDKIQAACQFTRIIAVSPKQRHPDMPYKIDEIYHADWSIAAKGVERPMHGVMIMAG